jgi:hypothetical protein
MTHRSSLLVARLALGATSLAVAQTQPPPSTDTPPASTAQPEAATAPAPATTEAPSSSDANAAKDQKLQSCIASEKAKNSGLSDDQVKQKCMLDIGSHQGH